LGYGKGAPLVTEKMVKCTKEHDSNKENTAELREGMVHEVRERNSSSASPTYLRKAMPMARVLPQQMVNG